MGALPDGFVIDPPAAAPTAKASNFGLPDGFIIDAPMPANPPEPPPRPGSLDLPVDNAPQPPVRPATFGAPTSEADQSVLNAQGEDAASAALKQQLPSGNVVQWGDKYYKPGSPTPIGSVPSMTAEQGVADKAARLDAATKNLATLSDPNNLNQFMTPQEIAAQGEFSFDVPADTLKARQAEAVKQAKANLATLQQQPIPQNNLSTDLANRALKSAGQSALDVAKPFGQVAADLGAPGLKAKIQSAQEGLPQTDPLRDKELSAQVASGLGGAAPFVAGGALGAGIKTLGAAGALQGFGSQYEAAQQAGGDKSTQYAAGILGLFTGAAQSLPIARLFEEYAPGSSNLLANMGRQALQGAIEFPAIQSAVTVGNNAIAQGLYDKNRDLFDGVRENAAAAALVGAFLGFGAGMHNTAEGRAKIADAAENFDWAATLGVKPDASPDEVKKAYYAKAKEAHPDNGGSTEAMQEVNAAYEIFKAKQAKENPQASAAPAPEQPQGQSTPAAPQSTPPGAPQALEAPGSATFARGPSDGTNGTSGTNVPPPPVPPDSPPSSSPAKPDTSQPTAARDAEHKTLVQAGYDDEDIATMSPKERAKALKEATDAGIPLGGDTGTNTPESPATLQAQQTQLVNGERAAVMYPVGTAEPDVPDGMKRVSTPRGVFHFNPALIDPMTIKRASRDGRENEVLGLGPYNKADVEQAAQAGEQPQAVVERDPAGNEIRAAAGVAATIPEQQAAMEKGKSPGNTVTVEPIADVLSGRAPIPAPPPGFIIDQPQGDTWSNQASSPPPSSPPSSPSDSSSRPGSSSEASPPSASSTPTLPPPRPEAPTTTTKGPKTRPQSLLAFLRARGGIKDDGGNLRAWDTHRRFPGLVNNKRGLDLDHAREIAEEAGYFGAHAAENPGNTTVNDLLKAIDQHPVFSFHDQDRVNAAEQDAARKEEHARYVENVEHEIRNSMADAGIKDGEIPDDLVKDAAKIVAEEGMAWDDALESAAIRSVDAPNRKIIADAGVEIPFDDYRPQEIAPGETSGGDQGAGSGGQKGNEPRAQGEDRNGHSQPSRGDEAQPHSETGRQGEGAGVRPRELSDLSESEFKKVKDAARYLRDFAYSTNALTDDKKALLRMATAFGKSARDTLLMEAFNVSRDAAHTINNGLDSSTPHTLRKIDMEDAFSMFPGLRRIVDAATGAAPSVEPGAEGKPQSVIPGAEKITDAELAQKKADERLKPKKPQAEGVGGMFDQANTHQTDLMDLASKPVEPPKPKAEEPPAPVKHPQHDEAVAALKSLGWKKTEAESFVAKATEQLGVGARVEAITKKAIQNQRKASREDVNKPAEADLAPTPKPTEGAPGTVGNPFADIAIRQERAYQSLVDAIKKYGDLSNEDAKTVADFYLKKKLAKLDAVVGQASVKHGGLYDKDAIAKALKAANGANPKKKTSADAELSENNESPKETVLRKGRASGKENAVFTDEHGAVTHEIGGGRSDFVGFPDELRNHIADPTQFAIGHHNHPADSSLSAGDVAQLGNLGLREVLAHGHEGTSHAARLTDDMRAVLSAIPGNKTDFILSAAREAHAYAASLLRPLATARGLSPYDLRREISHVANTILHRANVIDYHSTFGKDVHAVASDLSSGISDFASILKGRINETIQRSAARTPGRMGKQRLLPARASLSGRPFKGLESLPGQGSGAPIGFYEGSASGGPAGTGRGPLGVHHEINGFREEHAPPFYSAVERAITSAKQAKAPPDQWLATIKNTPGVKPEELKWLGIEPWLKSQTGTVTRDQVADYVRANNIQIKEVAKGANRPEDERAAKRRFEIDDKLDELSQREIAAGRIPAESPEWKALADEWEKIQDDLQRRAEEVAPSKYSSYALPGGKNYRELLLTLPEKPDTFAVFDGEKRVSFDHSSPAAAREWALNLTRQGRTGLSVRESSNNPAPYKSSHWEEPNILAHVRFDEREVNGERVLHLAEVQSDWHQAGRKEGYAPANPDPLEQRPYDEVPDAPFKTTWPELALKRMIRYAAENGFDRLSWDTGATNAGRYPLEKQVDRISYWPATKSLKAFKDNSPIIEREATPEQLPDLIGKEAADKLINTPTRILYEKSPTPEHRLEGVDLRVGGEGMKGFYDQILPAAVNKMVKKFGTRVEQGAVETHRGFPAQIAMYMYPSGDFVHDFNTREEAHDWAVRQGYKQGAYELKDAAAIAPKTQPVHSVKITPELRKHAVEQGFGFFESVPEKETPRTEATREVVDNLITELLPKGLVTSEIHDRLLLTNQERVAAGVNDREALGAYDAKNRIVQISMQAKFPDAVTVHEIFHAAMEAGLATPQEARILARDMPRLRRLLETMFPGRNWDSQPDHEIAAYAAQAYWKALQSGTQTSLHVGIRKLFQRFFDFTNRLWSFAHGDGFQMPEDIFATFATGGWKDRAPGESQMPDLEGRAPSVGLGDFNPMKRSGRDAIIEHMQDLSRPVKRLQEEFEQRRGAPFSDVADFYASKRLYIGRMTAQAYDFKRDHVEPFYAAIKASGLTRAEVSDGIYALAAFERNAYIASINPAFPDGGSGMTNAEGTRILDKIGSDPEKKAAFSGIVRRFAAMREYDLDNRVAHGLMTQAEADEWRQIFPNYAPARGFDIPREDEDGPRFPSRFDVWGKESKQAFGRKSKADDPLSNMIQQVYQGIDRGERNHYLQALYRALNTLKRDGVDVSDIVKITKSEPYKYISNATGQVTTGYRPIDKADPSVVTLKIGGREISMKFRDPELAQAIQRMRPDDVGFVANKILTIQNQIKSVWTHYSPDFLIRHFLFRYPIEGMLNFQELKDSSDKASTLRFIKDTFASVGDLMRVMHGGQGSAKYDAYIREMREQGGVVEFRQMQSIDLIKHDLERALKDISATRQKFRDAREAFDRLTNAMDNAIRLASYIQHREAGFTPKQAALKARDATIDYMLKGRAIKKLGIFFPFFNVAGQTGHRFYSAGKRSPAMRRTIATMLLAATAFALWNYWAGGVDKRGKPNIEAVPEWERRMNFLVMNPFDTDSEGRPIPIKIPLPYSFAMVNFTGSNLVSEAMRQVGIGTIAPSKAAASQIRSVIEAFTPFGEEDSFAAKLVPEIARPLIHNATNQKWTGAPVYREAPRYPGQPVPANSEQGGFNVEGPYKAFAKGVNAATGGSAYRSGAVDMHPEQVKEFVDHFFGAQIRLGERVADMGRSIVAKSQGATITPPDRTDIPLLRVINGQNYDASDRNAYYDERAPAYAAENEVHGLAKSGDSEGAAAALKAHEQDFDAASIFHAADRQRAGIYKQIEMLEKNSDQSTVQKQQEFQRLRQQELQIMNAAREQLNELRASYAQRKP